MALETIRVPDIGGSDSVDVIEICVAVGDVLKLEDTLLVLESDKASMDIPAPLAGKVTKLLVKVGDKVSQGDPVLEVELAAGSSETTPVSAPVAAAPIAESVMVPVNTPAAPMASAELAVAVPDIGGSENVDVIEICVKVGQTVKEGDSLIVLETDKASMEVPSPAAGTVVSIAIKEGDKVSAGVPMLVLSSTAAAASVVSSVSSSIPAPAAAASVSAVAVTPVSASAVEPVSSSSAQITAGDASVYAGPAVRKLARQLGVQLNEVKGSGPRSRLIKDDVRNFVKTVMTQRAQGGSNATVAGSGIPPIPTIDFAQFGEIELVKMSKIKKVTALNMTRAWLNVPHVTQFDDADISELEVFRKAMKDEADKAGVKLTPVPFILKACAAALKAEPSFNVSLHADGEHIVHKKYIHIGMAVDTPNGLVVPVIRDVDKKGLFELSAEAALIAKKAREGKLLPKDMQGGCFTISSLGAIGGTGFTPIVNAPEVAILGISRADTKPVWDGKQFVPKLMLPLCLSYDHRAINGGDAGRFLTLLSSLLSDVRRLLL